MYIRPGPNVAAALNELPVDIARSFSDRSHESFIPTLVKRRSLDTAKFMTVHIKVGTEACVVYLMDLVTQPEADASIKVARTTGDVKKVNNLFDIITPAKARELDIAQANNGQPTEEKNP